MMMMMQQKQQRVIHHPRNEILHSSKRRRFHHGATTIQTTTRRKSRGKYGRGCGARKAVTSFSSVSANKVDDDESKDIDVVTLGNMCVDVFHSVESLPEDKNELKTMETLNDLLTRTEKMKAMLSLIHI